MIITDVRMPGPDGWEVARRIREASSDVTLPKPFTLEELIGIIDRLVPFTEESEG